jgi:hypothetical protein
VFARRPCTSLDDRIRPVRDQADQQAIIIISVAACRTRWPTVDNRCLTEIGINWIESRPGAASRAPSTFVPAERETDIAGGPDQRHQNIAPGDEITTLRRMLQRYTAQGLPVREVPERNAAREMTPHGLQARRRLQRRKR